MAKFLVNGQEYETDDDAEAAELRADPECPEIHEASAHIEMKVN
jgi:hypothetical protein